MSYPMSLKCPLALAFGTGVLLSSLAPGQASAQDYSEFLLPDMMPWISRGNSYSHRWRLDSSFTEFSATTTLLNLGEGHLEFNDVPPAPGTNPDTVAVMQTLTRPDGSTEEFLAGNMVHHDGHTHFHFEGYAVQRIREIGPDNSIGAIVAEGEKISFCMIDLDEFDSSTNTPSSGRFGCGLGTQGISAGWGDIYSSGLDGQQIDISGLSRDGNGQFNGGLNGTGRYWFEIELDVDNQMIESNNNNNTAQLMIDFNQVSGSSRRGDELDDHANRAPDSGDFLQDATRLDMDVYRFGEVNWRFDTDMFAAEVEEGALYTISMAELQMHHGDLTVHDAADNQVYYESVGQDQQQQATFIFRANADGDYLIEVGETLGQPWDVTNDGSYLVHIQQLAIAGDVNQDGSVDIHDLDILLANWGDTVTRSTGADLNDDGIVNGLDQQILMAHFGTTGGPSNVPEPGSLALLGLAGLALTRRRRR